MIRDRLERIKERAYALWERAGGSHGEHEAHWHQASTEIDEEDVGSQKPAARRKPASGPKNAAKRGLATKTVSTPAARSAAKPSPGRKMAKPLPATASNGPRPSKREAAEAPMVEAQGEAAPAATSPRSREAATPAPPKENKAPKEKAAKRGTTKR